MPLNPPPTLKAQVITQAIAVVVFVVLPVVITLMVPFTDLQLRHTARGVTVEVKRYVLMLVPWQTLQIADVRALRVETTPEVHYRDTAENRRKGRAGATSYSTGQLVVVGEGPEVIVQAAPELARDVSARFEQFRSDRSRKPETVHVYASWSLSYLLGGTVTALAGLYILGALLAVLSFALKSVRGARA